MSKFGKINNRHRYLILNRAINDYVGSTDKLEDYAKMPSAHVLVDTIGQDGLGTMRGNKGIPDFLRAKKLGERP